MQQGTSLNQTHSHFAIEPVHCGRNILGQTPTHQWSRHIFWQRSSVCVCHLLRLLHSHQQSHYYMNQSRTESSNYAFECHPSTRIKRAAMARMYPPALALSLLCSCFASENTTGWLRIVIQIDRPIFLNRSLCSLLDVLNFGCAQLYGSTMKGQSGVRRSREWD